MFLQRIFKFCKPFMVIVFKTHTNNTASSELIVLQLSLEGYIIMLFASGNFERLFTLSPITKRFSCPDIWYARRIPLDIAIIYSLLYLCLLFITCDTEAITPQVFIKSNCDKYRQTSQIHEHCLILNIQTQLLYIYMYVCGQFKYSVSLVIVFKTKSVRWIGS